jgi:hypothetical protein
LPTGASTNVLGSAAMTSSTAYDAFGAAASAVAAAAASQTAALTAVSGQCLQATSGGSFSGIGTPCSYLASHITGSQIFLNMMPAFITSGTITDLSGNGNNGVECTGINAPVQTTVGLYFNNGTPTDYACVNLPSAVNGMRTFEYAINIPAGSTSVGSSASIMLPSQAVPTAPMLFLSAYLGASGQYTTTPGFSLHHYGGTAVSSSGVVLSAGNHTVIVTLGNNASTDLDHIYFDGIEVSPYNTHTDSAGLLTSGNWMLGGNQLNSIGNQAQITMYEFIGFAGELNATQVAQESQAMTADMAQRGAGATGLPWNTTGPRFVAFGDSLTFCLSNPTPANCWVNQPPAPVPTFSAVVNLGNAGKTADFLLSTTALLAPQYCSANGGPNVAAVFDGTNNFVDYSNATPTNTAQYIAMQVQLLKTAGCRVFVGTMINRGAGFGAPVNGMTWQQNEDQLDTIIRQQAVKTWGADGILDFAADPSLGCSTCNTNATIYQSDQTHLTAAGYLLTQNAAFAAMEYVFGSNKSSPNFILQTPPAPPPATAGAAATATAELPAGWAVVNPTPLISGPISSVSFYFNTAPAAVPITLALATGTTPSYTIVPGSSFTITPAATSGLQTFVAGTGFTAPLNAVAGEFPVVWGASNPTISYGSGSVGWYYMTGQATLPSGAHTYTLFPSSNLSYAMTVTPASVTTTSYSMLPSDGYIELNSAGLAANETLTLPSCVGQTGAQYTINNSTSFTVTLKTLNSTQPIDGTDYSTTGLTLPTGKNFEVWDVANPLGTTSGCHWSY